MAKSKISASYDNSAPFYRKLITVPPLGIGGHVYFNGPCPEYFL